MIILFTLWYILKWQFPTWLWVMSGFFYVISLRPKKKIKKEISFKTQVLPFSLLLALIFGVDSLGNPILSESISNWTVIGIFLGSVFIRLIVASPVIKKQIYKSKDSDRNVTMHGGGIIENDDKKHDHDMDDDELKLHINIKNKENNKNFNFKIGLENGFIKEKIINNIVLRGMKKSWQDPVFHDESGNPLFDIDEIYNQAKNNPIRGEILSIDNEKVFIKISIK